MKYLLILTLVSCSTDITASDMEPMIADNRVCYEHSPCRIIENYEMTSVIQCGENPHRIIETHLLDEPVYCWE